MKIHSRGGVIGYIDGKDIVEWITYEMTDESLQRFKFDRIAMQDIDGGVPLHQLADGEFMMAPGAVYK